MSILGPNMPLLARLVSIFVGDEPLPSDPSIEVQIIGFSAALLVFVILPLRYLIKWRTTYYPRKVKAALKPYLHEIPFYKNLSIEDKKRFEKRVQVFLNTKTIISRSKGLRINARKKALIAGTAVELTFGFKRFDFDHFSKILLYRNDYYSTISKQYHRGEVNIRGFIVLSWASFEKGHADRNDGINLGIHEMAHALKLENRIVNHNYQFIDADVYKAFHREFESFSGGFGSGQGFLRDYAKTNIHEFFAVCCENFFERPKEFKSKAPDIYTLISIILRQDLAKL